MNRWEIFDSTNCGILWMKFEFVDSIELLQINQTTICNISIIFIKIIYIYLLCQLNIYFKVRLITP